MGLEEVDRPKGARKERRSKLMSSMWCRKVRMGHNKARSNESKENKESKGLMESPWAPRMKDKVIRPRKLKGVSKSPWECRANKRAKRAQGK